MGRRRSADQVPEDAPAVGPLLHAGRSVGALDLLARSIRGRPSYRQHRLLVDPEGHANLARHGYHVTDEAISDEAIVALSEGSARWSRASGPHDDGCFYSSYGSGHEAAGIEARACIIEHLLPALTSQLTEEARPRPSVFQCKPPGPVSGVRLHQDRSMVNEQDYYGIFAWVALTEVDMESGPLVVVPGSHRYATWTRVYTRDDPLERYQTVLERHARALVLRPGQVIWFDNALIHGSLVNQSQQMRLGVSAVAVPRSSRMALAVPSEDHASPTVAAVHELEPAAVVGATPVVPTEGRLVGYVGLDQLTFGPGALDLVARSHARLHRGAPGVRLPAGPICATP